MRILHSRKSWGMVFLLVVPFVLTSIAAYASGQTAFRDDFSASTLDPAWSVRPSPPPYSAGQYSLTENPGYLRYRLTGTTHPGGDEPSLWIYRQFEGSYWRLDFKINYYTTPGLGRGFNVYVFFGGLEQKQPGGKGVQWGRGRDDGYGRSFVRASYGDGGTGYTVELNAYDYVADTYFVRVTRLGQDVSMEISPDGVNYTPLFEHAFVNALGFTQTILLSSSSFGSGNNMYADHDYFEVASFVTIDIKPGGLPNSINLDSKGCIPVAILTNSYFDASNVDPDTVLFAGAEAVSWELQDVDSDGDVDMLCFFRTSALDLTQSSTQGVLTGSTYDNQQIEACDSVRIVPPNK